MWFYQLLAFGGFYPRKAVKLKKQLFCPFLRRVFCWTIFRYISVQFSRSVESSSLWLHGLQHARLPCPTPTAGGFSNSCPSGQWCHPTISSTVVPFFSCLPSFPASGSFLMSQFFTSGGQSIGVSASASVFPMEGSRESLKTRNKTTIWPSNTTTRHTPWGNQNWKTHVPQYSVQHDLR